MDLGDVVETTGVLVVLGTHLGTIFAGAYEGIMHGQGKTADVPLRYIWPANIAITGTVAHKLNDEWWDDLQEENRDDATIMSAVLTPLEFAAGYGLGYAVGKLF